MRWRFVKKYSKTKYNSEEYSIVHSYETANLKKYDVINPINFSYTILDAYSYTNPELIGAVVLMLFITYTNVSEYKLLSNTMSPTLVNVRYLSDNCSTGSIVLDPVA